MENYRDVFDKLKADIRLMKEEVAALERSHNPKVSRRFSLDFLFKLLCFSFFKTKVVQAVLRVH